MFVKATKKKVASASAADESDAADADAVPLSTWLSDTKNNDFEGSNNDSLIRRTTVAYGIVELLKCSKSKKLDNDEIRIDNFVVFVFKEPSRSWDDVKGVGMISSGMSLIIEEPSFLRDLLEDADSSDRIVGRCLEVEVTSTRPQENLVAPAEAKNGGQNDYLTGIDVLAAVAEESNHCHLFARILFELFACEPLSDDALAAVEEPPQKRKKIQNHDEGVFDKAEIPFQIPCIVRMQELGIPASICLMTQNLLECALRADGRQPDDAYESLGVVSEDLHLLLLDPDRFLFDNQNQDTDDVQLLYRTDKLYGRDKEEALIVNAFCRVSRGKSEAFFIGGFSGSGKSMLVDSLRDTVKAIGGYVIKHKFDPMPREKPLSGVLSAFNQLCLLIKGRARPAIAQKLRNEFGVDFSLLMKLLPNVSVLFPEFVGSAVADVGDAMNARSVCFMLLRFVRLISSPNRPVMLFLDDMQWADNTALDVIHTILSDRMGTCMFFVGTYRDNEVQVGHDIFDLIERLDISNVRTTKLRLTGLNREDLNTMISDALCLYPRICKSLTDIVFQKTKGNPFFMLELVQSLQSRGLLRYNLHQKLWVWNEDVIRGEDITDNVLHLLSSKMNGLPDNVQTLLTVMACFGSSTNESVVGYLSESAQYTDIRDGLTDALRDGFIKEDGEGHLQFVHDKIREAAYDLIPDSDKKQFHFQLGKVLQHSCDGKDVGDTIFLIANQINHGKEWILSDKDYSIVVAELNMKAGKKAIDRCDHKTAYSYFGAAMSLLPKDHCESHYDLSLSLHFLASRAANSTCQYDEAEQLLRRTLGMARCLDDQLPSYHLLTQILHAQGKVNEVYTTCSAILTELGETIPESYTFAMASRQVIATLNAYEKVGDHWIKGKKTADKTLYKTLQFYNAITLASYFCKSYSMVIYFACKAVQLSLQRELCEHTSSALIQFTSVVTKAKEDNAALCYRIAKNAMSLQERFDVAASIPELYLNFYGFIAWRFESFQSGIDNLRQGFEAGLSCGHASMGLHCAFLVIRNRIYSGANLNSIMKEIDYYLHILETYESELTRNYLLIFRETVSTLIDNGQTTSIDATPCVGDLDDQKNKLLNSVLHNSAIRCFWLGHSDRCWYYREKCSKCMNPFDQGRVTAAVLAKFFFGLNALDLSRKNKHVNRTNEVIRVAIATLKSAAANSDWNFTNKLLLLEAEKQSLQEQHWRAIDLYDASIASAKRSGFIHEQGLACEKAGLYFMRVQNKEKALEYFEQARECYQEWGSSMKVAFIQKELDSINLTTTIGRSSIEHVRGDGGV